MTTLGKTGLQVSRLGVGLVGIGALTLGDQKQVGQLLNAALDSGINFLDTAECYGLSEELIGRTVAHRRGEFILATKAGHVAGDCSGQPWTAETIGDSIDRSLLRMRTDYLDLVQLHAYDVPVPLPDEVVQAILDARQAGKTRFIGFSGDNDGASWAVESELFDALQTSLNLVDQRARAGLFKEAEAKRIGVIIKHPIANVVWGAHRSPTSSLEDYFERAQAMASLGPIPRAPDDPILLALGFVFAHPEVDTAIVGTRSLSHLRANVDLLKRLPIPADAVEELHRRFDVLGANWLQRN